MPSDLARPLACSAGRTKEGLGVRGISATYNIRENGGRQVDGCRGDGCRDNGCRGNVLYHTVHDEDTRRCMSRDLTVSNALCFK